MNKEGWKKQLKEMKRLLVVAKGNVLSAQNQVDELAFNVINYKAMVKRL